MNRYLRTSDSQFFDFAIELTQGEIDLFQAGQLTFNRGGIDYTGVSAGYFVSHAPVSVPDWKELQQELYQKPLFQRVLMYSGSNVFTYLTKIFTDGIAGIAVESTLQNAITLVRSTLGVNDFTPSEIVEINEALQKHLFTFTIS